MLLGHFAVGLAARRTVPEASLATWFLAVQLVDLIWPLFLLAGLEHVRVAPGITTFTPLDFYHYPFTHSLLAGVLWGAALGLVWIAVRRTDPQPAVRRRTIALLLGAGVLSHWLLDAIVHRPDLPVVPGGPYVGLALWNSIPGTLLLELTMFGAGVLVYVKAGPAGGRRLSFWLLMGVLLLIYLGAAFGPPPLDAATVMLSAFALWLVIPWAWWAER